MRVGRGRRVGRVVGEVGLSVLALGGLVCLAFVVAALVFKVTVIMFATGSMSPTIPAGSIAFVREIPATEMRVGDVVTVTRDPDLPITHRVVEILAVDGATVSFTMRGDANPGPDPVVYAQTHVRQVWWSIPGVAPVLAWFRQPFVLGAVTVAVAALVTWAFWPRRRPSAAPDSEVVAGLGALGHTPPHPQPTSDSVVTARDARHEPGRR